MAEQARLKASNMGNSPRITKVARCAADFGDGRSALAQKGAEVPVRDPRADEPEVKTR